MIEPRTVFILGAGSNCCYGFPTAKELRAEICADFIPQYEEYLSMHSDLRISTEIAKEFRQVFFDSHTESIDIFLSRNLDFMDIGKSAIIFRIFEAERRS